MLKNKILNLSARLLSTLIPVDVLLKLPYSYRNPIVCLYHTVSDEDLIHIKHLYSYKNEKQFEDDLDFILRIYEPLTYSKYKQIVLGEIKSDKPSILFTFDDGLREFYDVIAPVLLKKGIPAICFLNNDFIDNKELFYRYKASILIEKLDGKDLRLKKKILSVNYNQKYILDDIAKDNGIDFNEFLIKQQPYLTSEQILELKEKGFQFGAHSFDHPNFENLTFDEQVRQINESVKDICERFGIDEKLFAFPFTDRGTTEDLFKVLLEKKVVDFTFGTSPFRNGKFNQRVQRISFEQARHIKHILSLFLLGRKISCFRKKEI